MSTNARDEVTSIIFISNLHCGSCIRTIEAALRRLIPSPHSIHVSIDSRCVTVRHPTALSCLVITEAIEDAGFDVAEDRRAGPARPSGTSDSHTHSRRAEKHLEQCQFCRNKFGSGHDAPGQAQPTSSLRNHPRQPTFEDHLLQEAATNRIEQPLNVPHRLTLSVGGMTCGSCITAVTQALSVLPGVHDISVSLLTNSATATLDNKIIVPDVLEAVTTIGYEADVAFIQPLNMDATTVEMDGPAGFEASAANTGPVGAALNTENVARGQRTVNLRIEGMLSDRCPVKVMKCLDKMSQILHAEPPTLQDPILRLTYEPSPPSFTLRDVVSAITSSNSPPFRVMVHQPPSLEDRAQAIRTKEKRSLLYRLVFSVIVAIPTFIIGVVFMSLVSSKNPTRKFLMEPMWTGNASRIQWSLFFLATPVMFYGAGKFHRRCLKEIHALWRRGSRTPVWKRFLRFGSMNLLVSSGVSVAYFSSIVLLGLAASTPSSTDGHADTSTYFDSVVFLTMFLLVGRYIEAYSKSRTGDAITSLAKLKPAEALVVGLTDKQISATCFRSVSEDIEKGTIDAETEEQSMKPGSRVRKIPVDLLEIGDVVRVPTGSTPPIDGIIISGHSLFDESSVTGESKPIKKNPGDHVFLGTINIGEAIDVRVDVAEGKTMLDHVIDVVRESQIKRAPIQRVADLLTAYFVPVVTLLAIITWAIWLSLGLSGVLPRSYLDKDVGGWPAWSLEFAIAVFVVACPCGIALAAPTALLVGTGIAAKFGILVRGGGEALQEAAQLDAVVFDKTGTLTVGGSPSVTDSEDLCDGSPWNRRTVLGIAAELEASSSHPLATAIRSYCESNNAIPQMSSSVEETPGRGLQATFNDVGCSAIIGNEAWMVEHGAGVPIEFVGRLESCKSEGKSVVLLAVRGHDANEEQGTRQFKVLILFAIADPVRPNAKAVVSHLQSRKLATWMISGDNATTARAVAKQVGIPDSNVIAGVLPHEKADKIRWLQKNAPKKQSRWLSRKRLNNRCVVAMVGDGINDAPALAAADVAIAVGSGSDVALSSASFILVSSDLGGILTLVDLSTTVFRRVKLNFLWALVYNIAMVPIAAGVLYPFGHIRLNPVWASLAMALSSISVVCSSLALRLYKPPKQQRSLSGRNRSTRAHTNNS